MLSLMRRVAASWALPRRLLLLEEGAFLALEEDDVDSGNHWQTWADLLAAIYHALAVGSHLAPAALASSFSSPFHRDLFFLG